MPSGTPTATPSIIPTVTPPTTPVPTATPTNYPTYLPTGTPTTSLQTQATIRSTLILGGINTTLFDADYSTALEESVYEVVSWSESENQTMAGVSVTIQEVNDVDSGSSSTRLLRALSVSTSVECILDIFIVLEVAGITEETVFDTITTSMTSTTTALQSNFHPKVEGVKNTTLSVTIDSIVYI